MHSGARLCIFGTLLAELAGCGEGWSSDSSTSVAFKIHSIVAEVSGFSGFGPALELNSGASTHIQPNLVIVDMSVSHRRVPLCRISAVLHPTGRDHRLPHPSRGRTAVPARSFSGYALESSRRDRYTGCRSLTLIDARFTSRLPRRSEYGYRGESACMASAASAPLLEHHLEVPE